MTTEATSAFRHIYQCEHGLAHELDALAREWKCQRNDIILAMIQHDIEHPTSRKLADYGLTRHELRPPRSTIHRQTIIRYADWVMQQRYTRPS